MENVKEKLERTLEYWDKLQIQIKHGVKWEDVPLSKVKDQSEIAKYIILLMSPYVR